MKDHTPPKIGEIWEVNGFEGYFFAVARDIIGEKFFIFQNDKDFFIIPKDEFYSAEVSKRKIK